MSAPSASASGPTQPTGMAWLKHLRDLMTDERPSQKAVEEFPRYMVKCWINDTTASTAAPAPFNPFQHSEQQFDKTYYDIMWTLLKRFNDRKSRFVSMSTF
jgi:hypothetical protein